jgi:hypothetical protein
MGKAAAGFWILVVLLGLSGCIDAASLVDAPSQPSRRTPPDTPQLLVSLANGQLVSLHQDTGELLWSFDTGAPLLSSANPAAAAAPSPDDAPPKEGIFPGTDGSLYAYRPGDDGAPRIEVSAGSIGRRAPSLTPAPVSKLAAACTMKAAPPPPPVAVSFTAALLLHASSLSSEAARVCAGPGGSLPRPRP